MERGGEESPQQGRKIALSKEVMTMKRICRECKAEITKGNDAKSLAAWLMNLCEYCYGMKFPERNTEPGIVIEGDAPDYDGDDDPYGWIDQFHGDMR